jgi:hypothetical protein
MRSKATKSKSPLNTLVEKLDHLIETQRHKLSKEEFQKADDNFKRIVKKARVSAARHPETA